MSRISSVATSPTSADPGEAWRAAVEAAALVGFVDPDVFGMLGYEPNCKVRHAAREAGTPEHLLPLPCGGCPQELFHAATEFDVLYGGAAGGGKTKALLMDGLRDCYRYDGLRVGAFRRTYGELRESLIAELAQVDFARALGARWNASEYDLTFPNGSVLMFRYAESLKDATRRQGGQYQKLLFDERTLTPPDVVDFLYTRLRSGRADIPVLGVRSGTNPGGPGHASVKAAYVDATDHGAKATVDDRGRSIRFIPSRVSDNPHLNAEYAQDLEALPEQMRAAFLDGSWDSFVGQVFTEWNRDRHLVPRFALPAEWSRLAGIDYGYAAPWAVVWGARDGDGRLWIYRELYDHKVGERDQARRILEAEAAAGEAEVRRAADPAMWAKTGDAMPVASQYSLEGCALAKANNDRLAGWARLHTALSDGPACAHHRALGKTTCPMLHVFDDACPNLIRTLPSAPYDPHRVEDLDTTYEDHALDALRYLVMSVGVGQSIVFAPEGERTHALDGRELRTDTGGVALPGFSVPDLAAAGRIGGQPSPFV